MNERPQTARRVTIGRLAGILFLVGALASTQANLLFHDPAVGPLNHVLVGLAIISGMACLVAPWERIPERVFHLVPVIASVEIALTVWAVSDHGPVYEWFFVLAAIFVAYASDSRRAVAAHMSHVSLAAALPLLYREDTTQVLASVGVVVPMLWVATAVVMHLREGLVARQNELAELARRDPLTGAGNRRLLGERLRYELARHRRSGRPLALLALDLDGFKAVNDRLGHPVGDRLLTDVAEALVATVRVGDTVVRHGGDEFCIVAPETDRAEAQVLAARIGTALAALNALDLPLTTTVGIAVFPEDAPTPELLLAAADRAERTAKSDRYSRPQLAHP